MLLVRVMVASQSELAGEHPPAHRPLVDCGLAWLTVDLDARDSSDVDRNDTSDRHIRRLAEVGVTLGMLILAELSDEDRALMATSYYGPMRATDADRENVHAVLQ